MIEKLKIDPSLLISPIAVVGLGISGRSTLALLLAAGISRDQIATYDKKSLADYQDEDLLLKNFSPRTLVISPGVPLSSPWIQKFRKSGGRVTSELELAFSILTSEKVIAVTGSVGKSTTVSLLESGVHSFASNSFVGGNLGRPLAEYSNNILEGALPCEWVILELSSYQLENFANLRAYLSSIVSLTPNHMERYADLEAYYLSKWKLIEKTQNAAVFNSRGGDLCLWAHKKSAPCPVFWTDRDDTKLKKWKLNEAKLLGAHNQDNLAVATQIALLAGWPSSSIVAMKSFPGLPHRLENLGKKNDVIFINDSKATTIESVRTAVDSLHNAVGNGVLHLLLGGRDKNLPWQNLKTLGSNRKINFYFFGECGHLAKTKSELSGEVFKTLSDCVHFAYQSSKPGDLVLLSPGGTSLDEFKSFEARGDLFRELFNSF